MSEEPATLAQMKLALRMRLAEMIVAADGVVDDDESAHLAALFPAALLDAHGFRDAGGHLTDTYHHALLEALERVPAELSEDERLGILGDLFRTSTIDGTVATSEAEILLHSADLLGLPAERIRLWIEAHRRA